MQIDPTYLRYIFDGLASNFIHQDNISTLPEGLIGVYEESLSQEQDVQSREIFLSFFSTWALLKKEVSASLVSILLNWPEQDVIDKLSIYSKWFNSSTSGTYILYHERLRVFLLEKISTQKLQFTNQKIITACQIALNQRSGDEWEIYALEHLPTHLLMPAMEHDQDGAYFKQLVYNTSYWSRQLEISKGFDWSNKMLSQAMVWAAKQSTDELIECALNKVDLHYMEQNDAPRIVELVAQNDIDTALQRIEAFGGNDKEGLQRKFILYMLCLMELTLLDSKDKLFRKSAIEQILTHLDEKLPVDHSLLNWNDFFPSYLIFLMACVFNEMDLNYLRIYERTGGWESNWILQCESISEIQFGIIMECTLIMPNDNFRSEISKVLTLQGKLEEALECASGIKDEWKKSSTLSEIANVLARVGRVYESIECTRGISIESEKISALKGISTELARLGKFKEAYECMNGITDESHKNSILTNIAIELSGQGKIEEAIQCAKSIIGESFKSSAFEKIAAVQAQKADIKGALESIANITSISHKNSAFEDLSIKLALQENFKAAIMYAESISSELIKNGVLRRISNEFVKQKRFKEALECVYSISNDRIKSATLSENSTEIFKQGNIEAAALMMNQAIDCALAIKDENYKTDTLKGISNKNGAISFITIEQVKQDKIEEAFNSIRQITIDYYRQKTLNEIFSELAKKGKLEQILEFANHFGSKSQKNAALELISNELAKQGRIKESLNYIKINDNYLKNKSLNFIFNELIKLGRFDRIAIIMLDVNIGINSATATNDQIKEIVIGLAKQGKIKEALQTALYLNDESIKINTLIHLSQIIFYAGNIIESSMILEEALSCSRILDSGKTKISLLTSISTELYKQGSNGKASMILNEAIESVQKIYNGQASYHHRNNALTEIYVEIAKQEKVEYAIKLADSLSDEIYKSLVLTGISSHLVRQGKKLEAKKVLEKAFAFVCKESRINPRKLECIKKISIEYAKQGDIEKAIESAQAISHQITKESILMEISLELAKKGKINDALELVRKTSNSSYKISTLKDISLELFKKGHFKESTLLIQEAIVLAKSTTEENEKSNALYKISADLVKLGEWSIAEEVGLEIPLIAKRQASWKEIGKRQNKILNTEIAFKNIHKFNSPEAKLFYLKGWAESISVDDISNELAYKAIQALMNDSTSLEHFLQVYAQHELFFGNPSREKVDRLNKTLNLQWALDIIDQFPKEEDGN